MRVYHSATLPLSQWYFRASTLRCSTAARRRAVSGRWRSLAPAATHRLQCWRPRVTRLLAIRRRNRWPRSAAGFQGREHPGFLCGRRDVDGHPPCEPTGRCQSAARNTADCNMPRLEDQTASAVTSAEVPGISTPECNEKTVMAPRATRRETRVTRCRLEMRAPNVVAGRCIAPRTEQRSVGEGI